MSSSGTVMDTLSADGANRSYTEFDYKPVPPLVPVSAAFVLLSLTAFAWDVLVAVPVIGSILALLAWRQVAKSDGTYGGLNVARLCLVLLPSLTLAAIAFHGYAYATEVPEGYRRISFATDISEKGFIVDEGELEVHPEVLKLTEEPLFLKGYMYPTRQTEDLPSFVLCKDSGDCCFGGQPKPTDMIYVEMEPGQTIDFRSGLVAVAGSLKATPTLDPTGLNPVYKLDCQYFGGAKTSY